MILKYIIIKNSGAILFPEELSHSQVGRLFLTGIQEIESAGFAMIENSICIGVYGEAVTLDCKKSLPGDEHVINDSIFNASSEIKYYHKSTQSVREEGLSKSGVKPSLLIVKVPDNWTEENLIQFKQSWQQVMSSPANQGAIKITAIDKIKEREWEPMYNKTKKKAVGIGQILPKDFPFQDI
jgi:hypothetical protein